MRREHARAAQWIAVVAGLVALGPALEGCSKKPSEPAVHAAATPPASTVAASDPPEVAPAVVHGLRKQKNLDVPVFVDGKQVSVLRYGELPPGIAPFAKPGDEHHSVRFYRVADYLKALGVNLDRVKAVHFADKGNRIASIEGSELRAEKDRFVFDFLEHTGGMPKQAWNTPGMKNMLRIDEIFAVNVFAETAPWEITKGAYCYVEDGDCKPVARFTSEDLMKGTRVYQDGKLLGYVKRRLLADSTLAGKTESGDPSFSMDRYLASLGIKTANAKEIHLLAGDEVIASATAKEWAADRDALTFYLVKHGHGKVRANIPADLQTKQEGARDRDVQVTSIQVFSRTEPRSVPLVSIDEIFDPGPNVAALESAVADAHGGHERDQQ
jgi:hypothetical protein